MSNRFSDDPTTAPAHTYLVPGLYRDKSEAELRETIESLTRDVRHEERSAEWARKIRHWVEAKRREAWADKSRKHLAAATEALRLLGSDEEVPS
jgi:hypothetical protein